MVSVRMSLLFTEGFGWTDKMKVRLIGLHVATTLLKFQSKYALPSDFPTYSYFPPFTTLTSVTLRKMILYEFQVSLMPYASIEVCWGVWRKA